jgi:hypothetical protein
MKSPMKRLAICWIICFVPVLAGQVYPKAFLLLPVLSIALMMYSGNMIFENSHRKLSVMGTIFSFASLIASVGLFSTIAIMAVIYEDYNKPIYVWLVFVLPFILLLLVSVLKLEARSRAAQRNRNFRRSFK